MRHGVVAVLLMALLMLSCRGQGTGGDCTGGDTLRFEYARLVHVVKYPQYSTLTIDNPWHPGHILHKYVLVDRDAPVPGNLPQGTVIKVPVQRSVMFTTTHCYLFGLLQRQDCVVGACDTKYILVPWVRQGIANGSIVDCGNGMEPLIEQIVDLRPDIMLLSPFENSGGYGKIEEVGIPYLECAEYMECSALARAEWMRVYGLLLGRQQAADSIFADVCAGYKSLMLKAAQSKVRRSIIMEKLTGNTWYVAGGQSSVGRLVADARGDYAYASDSHAGSLALPFEAVLDKAGDADVWIFNFNQPLRQGQTEKGRFTYDMLKAEYHGYTSLKAFADHNVWYVNTLTVPYFEEVSFHPDYLLRDYVILLHPDLDLGQLRYYKPLSR